MYSYKKIPRTPDAIVCVCFFTLYYFLFNFSVSFLFIVSGTLLFYSNLFYETDKRFRVVFLCLVFFTIGIMTLPTIDFNKIESKTVSSYSLNFTENNNEYTHYFTPSGLFFYPDKTLPCVGKVTMIQYATLINMHSEKKKLILSASCLDNGQRVTIDLQDEYVERLMKYKLGVWVYLLNSIVIFVLILLGAFQRYQRKKSRMKK